MNQAALREFNQQPVIRLVDDDVSFRRAIQRVLQTSGYLVEDYGSVGDMLLAGVGNYHGCLILDIHMPGPSGLDLQDMLKAHANSLPVIFVTGEATVRESVRAMKAGAADFLLKPIEAETLLAAVDKTLQEASSCRQQNEQFSSLRTRYASLSSREKEIVNMVGNGMLNKQISAALNVAERTVKAHRARAMEKMEVRTLAELVRSMEQLYRHNTERETISHLEAV
ncbi:response regulator transcription factor [Oxalicibacterium solurbis]|uniref:DNA-binding response regulator n=1 Tax=Oxalicibacterium solurbis TaxID=69280 RepID=A0A8J3ATY3_9BURK|nr:response regulator [Oxalicibacterium solurbis]GGI52852.1 DNA-binding response regulator [Oxalicibacterium solurbis]